MLFNLRIKKSKSDMCKRAYRLTLSFFMLFTTALLFGCEKSKDIAVINDAESLALSSAKNIFQKQETMIFAPTAGKERKGLWHGGAPPINKRASEIDTYYRIKAGVKPNQLKMTLRFEGVTSDDAKVVFRAIDGAKFDLQNQQTQWRLEANIASEVSFTLLVPDNLSYLTLDTFQNNKGASRAFKLKVPTRVKR